MKNYSDNIVTTDVIDNINETQTKEIHKLQVLLAVSFGVNLAVSIGLFLFF